MNTQEILLLVQTGLNLAKDIIEAIIAGTGDISDKKIKDLPSWKEWEKASIEPNMKKFLEEYRKAKK